MNVHCNIAIICLLVLTLKLTKTSKIGDSVGYMLLDRALGYASRLDFSKDYELLHCKSLTNFCYYNAWAWNSWTFTQKGYEGNILLRLPLPFCKTYYILIHRPLVTRIRQTCTKPLYYILVLDYLSICSVLISLSLCTVSLFLIQTLKLIFVFISLYHFADKTNIWL